MFSFAVELEALGTLLGIDDIICGIEIIAVAVAVVGSFLVNALCTL